MTVTVSGHGTYNLTYEQGTKEGYEGPYVGKFYTVAFSPKVLSKSVRASYSAAVVHYWKRERADESTGWQWVVTQEGSSTDTESGSSQTSPMAWSTDTSKSLYNFCDAVETLDSETRYETEWYRRHETWTVTVDTLTIEFRDLEYDSIAYNADNGQICYAADGIVYGSYAS